MKSLADLQAIREKTINQVNLRKDQEGYRIVVGMATCGIAAGARPVMMALVEEVQKRNLKDVAITQTGCIGVCRLEPIVEIYEPGGNKVTYVKMTPEKAVKVVIDHVANGTVVVEYTIGYHEEHNK